MRLSGTVIGGNKIGRTLGFPTANISLADDVPVADGVYAAVAEIDGRRMPGMAFVGRKPTVSGGGRRVLEVNVFDFEGDLYGRTIGVELLDYIRPERRFDSFEQLKEQIIQDKNRILCTLTKPSPTK